MKYQKQIDFLLNNACTSNKFFVHRDFLHTPLTETFVHKLHDEILEQENIKKSLACQHPDGWLGDKLHGGKYDLASKIRKCGIDGENRTNKKEGDSYEPPLNIGMQ